MHQKQRIAHPLTYHLEVLRIQDSLLQPETCFTFRGRGGGLMRWFLSTNNRVVLAQCRLNSLWHSKKYHSLHLHCRCMHSLRRNTWPWGSIYRRRCWSWMPLISIRSDRMHSGGGFHTGAQPSNDISMVPHISERQVLCFDAEVLLSGALSLHRFHISFTMHQMATIRIY